LNQPRPGPGLVLARVPYPGFSNILFVESGANSEFHSLQATLNRPLRRGLFLLATYMMSKSIDDASAFLGTQADKNFPQDSQHYRLERAVSSFDVHQRATAALVYHLPGGSRLTRHIEASSVITVQGGQPFTPALSFDNSNSGNVGGQFGNDRPELLGNPHLSNPTPGKWFQTAAFAIPPRYTFGSAGRNILRGPGLVSIDLSLRKRFYIRESNSISLEAQIFNLLNRVNFDLPQAVVDQSTAFGAIFSAKAPRQIQVALRYRF
jgi:hypothetical protein